MDSGNTLSQGWSGSLCNFQTLKKFKNYDPLNSGEKDG
jgi:hypothetical protein